MRTHSSDADSTGSARKRLLDAALDLLVECGYRGATSRKIAQAAGVNEITLFRYFASKDDLFAAALAEKPETGGFNPPAVTGHLEDDLLKLADELTRVIVSEKTFFLRLIPELPRMTAEQQIIVSQAATVLFRGMAAIFQHYQRNGQLDHDSGDMIVMYFLGPIFAYYMLGDLYGDAGEFNNPRFVRQFLAGHQTHTG